jgi:hypothetical protein
LNSNRVTPSSTPIACICIGWISWMHKEWHDAHGWRTAITKHHWTFVDRGGAVLYSKHFKE